MNEMLNYLRSSKNMKQKKVGKQGTFLYETRFFQSLELDITLDSYWQTSIHNKV